MPGGVYVLGGMCARGGACIAQCPSVNRILDTRLSKHYLPATTVADGNKTKKKRRK